MKIRIAIPNRGRLYDLTKELIYQRYNMEIGSSKDRRSIININTNLEIVKMRSTDIPHFLFNNTIQLGITGNDYYIESGYKLVEIGDLHLLNGKLAVICRKDSEFSSLEEVLVSNKAVCYSQYPYLSSILFKNFPNINVKEIDGAAETLLNLGMCDIVVDIISSGRSYVVNNLKVLTSLFSTSAYLYSNKWFSNKHSILLNKLTRELTGTKFSGDINCTNTTFLNIVNSINNYIS